MCKICGTPGHWIQVRLRGTRSNRDGIGARIAAHVGQARLVREIRRNTGYAGSTLPVAHFGLGSAEEIERLEVRWPSGAVSVLEQVAADRILVLDETGATP